MSQVSQFPSVGKKNERKHQCSAYIIGSNKSTNEPKTHLNEVPPKNLADLAASTKVSFETIGVKTIKTHTSFSGIEGKGFTHLESRENQASPRRSGWLEKDAR